MDLPNDRKYIDSFYFDRQYQKKEKIFKKELSTLSTLLPTLHTHLVTCSAFTSSANRFEFLDLAYVRIYSCRFVFNYYIFNLLKINFFCSKNKMCTVFPWHKSSNFSSFSPPDLNGSSEIYYKSTTPPPSLAEWTDYDSLQSAILQVRSVQLWHVLPIKSMLKQDVSTSRLFFAAFIILYFWVIFRCLEPLLFPSRVPGPLGNITASPPLTNSTPSIPRYRSCK